MSDTRKLVFFEKGGERMKEKVLTNELKRANAKCDSLRRKLNMCLSELTHVKFELTNEGAIARLEQVIAEVMEESNGDAE